MNLGGGSSGGKLESVALLHAVLTSSPISTRPCYSTGLDLGMRAIHQLCLRCDDIGRLYFRPEPRTGILQGTFACAMNRFCHGRHTKPVGAKCHESVLEN